MVKGGGSSTSSSSSSSSSRGGWWVAAALAEMATVAMKAAAAAAAVIGVVTVVVRGWAEREAVISCIVVKNNHSNDPTGRSVKTFVKLSRFCWVDSCSGFLFAVHKLVPKGPRTQIIGF